MEALQPEAGKPDDSLAVPPVVGLWELFFAFFRLGLMTFGGAVQSWLRRDIIQRRKWVDEETFVTGLSMATVLPGANPVNMSLYLGMRIRGGPGGRWRWWASCSPPSVSFCCSGWPFIG